MNETQIAGVLLILIGAVPAFVRAVKIKKHKNYSAFSNWNPARISDADAYGRMLCKGYFSISIALAALGILMALNFVSNESVLLVGILFSVLPWYYYKEKAKRLYGK